MYAHVQTATSAPSASTAAEEQAIRNSLARISVQDPRTGKTRIWRMSQPVKIWSQSAGKWCPGEISYITQDADGYCLDVRYWAKPQLPKAKYLAPLSECLRAIGIQFVCRDEWTQGSKVECFSNSQKRWYKATVVDVIRYPDDKEDWLKIQWSLDLSSASQHANDETPTPGTNSAAVQPQIMSKEVGRSSIWIRHRYPSFRHDAPPEIETSTHHSQQSKQPHAMIYASSAASSNHHPVALNNPYHGATASHVTDKSRHSSRKSKRVKSKKRSRDREQREHGRPHSPSVSPSASVSQSASKDLIGQILHQQPRAAEYSQPQSTAIRKFEVQQPQTQAQPPQVPSPLPQFPDAHAHAQHPHHDPLVPSMSKKISSTSVQHPNLTPQCPPETPNVMAEEEEESESDSEEDHSQEVPQQQQMQTAGMQSSPEFGAQFKPEDYEEKNVQVIDEELMGMFEDSSEYEEDGDDVGEEDRVGADEEDGEGSVLIKNSDNELENDTEHEDIDDDDDDGDENAVDANAVDEHAVDNHVHNAEEEEEADDEDTLNRGIVAMEDDDDAGEDEEEEEDEDSNQRPILVQSDSRLASSSGGVWEEEKKELCKEIEELRHRLEISEQDLNEERETSDPLLKEVEIQKIKIAKLREENLRLRRAHQQSDGDDGDGLSPVSSSPKAASSSSSSSSSTAGVDSKSADQQLQSKLEEFKKTMATPHALTTRSKRTHARSRSFTSNSSLQSLTNRNTSRDGLGLFSDDNTAHSVKNRFEGLKAQELIDAIYDRKVQLLTEQVQRMQLEHKKKEQKISELKTKETNRQREIQLLETELQQLKNEFSQPIKKELTTTATPNIGMYREQVRKLTQTNDQLVKSLQTAHDNLKLEQLKKQDIQEERKEQSLLNNRLQQKAMRALQQNTTIADQIEKLHALLLTMKNDNINANSQHHGGHGRFGSNSGAFSHLDTIRKCNMRAVQILQEVTDKQQRRKRSDHQNYTFAKYPGNNAAATGNGGTQAASSSATNLFAKQRKSYRVPNMSSNSEHSENVTAGHANGANGGGEEPHHGGDEYHQYRSTKSTRFSSGSKRGPSVGGGTKSRASNENSQSNSNSEATSKPKTRKFDFSESSSSPNDAVGGSHSTRSRAYMQYTNAASAPSMSQSSKEHSGNTAPPHHHQQRSHTEHMMRNMQPLVFSHGHSSGELHQAYHQGNTNGSKPHDVRNTSGYNGRMKRVSYDYVDGSQQQQQQQQQNMGTKYQHKKQTLYSNSGPHNQQHPHHTYGDTFDEHEEQNYEQYPPPPHHAPHHPQQQQQQHQVVLTPNHVHNNELSMMTDEHPHDVDYNAYLNKWWTVKFPRRSSKVGLFQSNSKSQKARIAFDANNYLVFECDENNSTRISVHDLKGCECDDKKNVCIYTRNGSKYKIKCDLEKEASFWYRVLNEFLSSN